MFNLNPAFVEIEAPASPSLLELAQRGDPEAYCELSRVYETRLLRQAMTLCGNVTLAEDLVQDTLVEGWKGLRRYNGRCQFFTWLCAILLHRYRNTVRQKRPIPVSSLMGVDQEECDHRLDSLTDAGPLPDKAAQIREESARLLACVQELPAKHQQVIYLRFYVDDSLEGIAAALRCSLGTVKSRLFRALDKLRAMNSVQVAYLETKGGS